NFSYIFDCRKVMKAIIASAAGSSQHTLEDP
ncbi:unnamed protein product, partial [marine sediment metagenome]